ncbi:septation ring formation regulator EzrA [Bacillus spongiae]|uniref:Septation ring formation regulator EzrA n=2 Tax=Bacillus spongiae TaxID=2683610 RepID=A0ABU8H810_9BACI
MGLLIASILFIIIIFSISTFLRRKHYQEVDALEGWKVDIMNRPVLEELSKVKQLNMTGETEELFEKWRQQWEEILSVSLPNVEEFLFDAEEHADKFRLKKAKLSTTNASILLQRIEKEIENILEELSELVGSEEKNRVEIEELNLQFQECRKQLLAHRHQFGEAASSLETELMEIKQVFDSFQELTNAGNYLEARELLHTLQQQYESVALKIEKTPDLLAQCQTILPSQLDEIQNGYIEMKEQGYTLDHLEIEQEVQKYIDELKKMRAKVSDFDVIKVEETITTIKEKIQSLYDLLEQEVNSKHYVVQNEPEIKQLLDELRIENDVLKTETDFVQQGYRLESEDLDTPRKLEKQLHIILNRYNKFVSGVSEHDVAFSFISDELKKIKEELNQIRENQTEFAQHLQNLRKDEMDARNSISELKIKLSKAIRMISKSNVPGLPEEYELLLDQAKEHVENAVQSLNEKPLNMKNIQAFLTEASDSITDFYEKTEELVEKVLLAEKVIQYGNRYRSRYSTVEEGLNSAEASFRSYQYQTALEQAAATVEEVEPGALKKIESWGSEGVS